MTSDQFVLWLRGFVQASHHYNLTPEGWEALKQNLNKVVIKEQQGIKYTVTHTGEQKQILHD